MQVDLTQVLIVFAIVATNIITVITLYIHTDNKMGIAIKAIHDEIRAVNDEMKDFHTRLIQIEERRIKVSESK